MNSRASAESGGSEVPEGAVTRAVGYEDVAATIGGTTFHPVRSAVDDLQVIQGDG
jgi:hypothetical protein